MPCTWLVLGMLGSVSAETPPAALTAGEDIQAWRALQGSQNPEKLQQFLATYQNSPLAELAVRALEDLGTPLSTDHTREILDSLLANEASLSQLPVGAVAAELVVQPLRPELQDPPFAQQPTVASHQD